MKISGARIIAECLLEQGVDTVFGYPGVSIIRVYDELYKKRGKIRHILTAHEQGAAHAADGYARATGRVGVCLATSGPGATNLITGIAAAFMDSSPVVFITCNVDEALLGRDAFQEVDITGISMPITKCSYLVRSAGELAGTIREAFALASRGRPGPVLVDVTYNATAERAEYEFLPKEEHFRQGRSERLTRRGEMALTQPGTDERDVKTLADMLRSSERPLIMAGGGVIRSAGAAEELRRICRGHGIPAVSTMMGLGAMPSDDGMFFGMAGMYGSPDANRAVRECDLLIAVGVRFSDRVTGDIGGFAPGARIAHVDIDRAEIDKNVLTAHHIVGDAGTVLGMLSAELEGYRAAPWMKKSGERKLCAPERIIKTVEKLAPGAVIVTDVGQHQLWACRTFGFSRPGQLLTSGGFGAMGFGLGAAIGAKAGVRDAAVIHITGDGSFRMNCPELATEARYGLDIISVIMDNSSLGLVRQKQAAEFGGRFYQTELAGGPDFVLLARAYGLRGERAENESEFESLLSDMLRSGKGGIIDCITDKDEMI
ncbi:MAG: biosynthetic-type acetolactate synthase large subunit [Clostridia bacterium]|jgi:acetolactate synthase-1/2/3 large subunit|nr:biosynthetic-type acetolactate synthase large subunit [Clostridia bacterium]MCR4771562.1 biosynthetic-type acetolactate synthase large subunit [Oscillospiraceae bacterium]